MKTCPHCDTGYPDSHTTCPTHGVLLNEIRDLKPGMVIHKTYRIVRKLGQGGMGTVYLAEHIHMGEQRALKFLSPELSRDQALTNRFLREVRTLRQVHSRHVVECGDLEAAEDDSLFFSMEFVDGPDLRGLLDNTTGPFPIDQSLEIVRGVAEGLGAAHKLGMVHRDIKPENILMASDPVGWVPKIADFGIVATKETSSTYTRTGGTLLTVAYAAPEQWRGTAAAELDGRTDLYALGCVLYEMVAGRQVFEAGNYEAWAEQHKNAAPRPPSSGCPRVASWKGLDALALQLLAKDPSQRPRNVAEVLALLDAITYAPLQPQRVTVRESPPPVPIQPTAPNPPVSVLTSPAPHPPASRSNKGLAVSFAVLVLLCLAGFVVWLRNSTQTTQPPPADTTAQSTPSEQPTQPQQQVVIPQPSAPKSVIPDQPKPAPADEPKPVDPTPSPEEIEKQGESFYRVQIYDKAMSQFTYACNLGNMKACNMLGFMYYSANGVPQDDSRALAFFTEACDNGDAGGCNNLGSLYKDQRGVTRNYAKAAELYSKACDAGSAEGCNNLGVMYHDVLGVSMDYVRAASLYQRACDGGSAWGCRDLGKAYLDGAGVPKDTSKARELLTKACNMGNQWACNDLKAMQ